MPPTKFVFVVFTAKWGWLRHVVDYTNCVFHLYIEKLRMLVFNLGDHCYHCRREEVQQHHH